MGERRALRGPEAMLFSSRFLRQVGQARTNAATSSARILGQYARRGSKKRRRTLRNARIPLLHLGVSPVSPKVSNRLVRLEDAVIHLVFSHDPSKRVCRTSVRGLALAPPVVTDDVLLVEPESLANPVAELRGAVARPGRVVEDLEDLGVELRRDCGGDRVWLAEEAMRRRGRKATHPALLTAWCGAGPIRTSLSTMRTCPG